MRAILLTMALCVGAACGGAALDTYLQAAPPAIEIGRADAVPAGTPLLVALRQPVGARVNGVGDRVAVDIVRPLASEGDVVVPIGTTIHGTVTAVARPATRGNQMAVAVRFDELTHEGRLLPIEAEVVAVEMEVGAEDAPRTTGHFAFGQVMDPQDAVNHTGISAGGPTGSVIALGTGDVDPVLHTGTRLTLRTTSAIPLR